jgi:hypothetical protein
LLAICLSCISPPSFTRHPANSPALYMAWHNGLIHIRI